MSRRKPCYVYHVYATYQPKGCGTLYQYDGIIESNGRIDRQQHLDITRSGVASKMAEMTGYTPPSENVVIQALSFLHERLK
jgi:hypothetical protein